MLPRPAQRGEGRGEGARITPPAGAAMTTTTAHPLDNPFWSALTTRQAHFALGGFVAMTDRRYRIAVKDRLAALAGAARA